MFEQGFQEASLTISSLPLWLAVIPMLGGIILYALGEKPEILRKVLALFFAFLPLLGVLWLYPLVAAGGVEYYLPGFLQLGLSFRVDLVAWIFTALITLIWFLATLYSWAYMDLEHCRRRYYSILIFTLGATAGVILAGDFFTLFLFFELMTFSSFVLVIHQQNRQSMGAGALYLYLGVAGGLALLFAIMLLFSAAGTVEMIPLLNEIGGQRTLIFILFLIGFGIKAGMVPLHIWLPQAHPVAPSPASALLSGIMIKAGAYGILRVLLMLYYPVDPGDAAGWDYLSQLGFMLLWFGIATMFAGAFMALLQNNAKRILAYSSVSQMGYILMGMGAAAYLGLEGGMGFAGSIYHIINHAFFKAGLFMMVGTVYIYTHELELPRLGGMARKMPLVAITFLIAAFGIAGIPGFNGFPSKTLLHDTLLIAYKDLGLFSIDLAERMFTLTSALTVCYFAKLFRGIFLGPVPGELDRQYRIPFSVNAVLGSFALFILAIGLFPNYILERLILPVAGGMGYAGYAMDHLGHFNFFSWEMMEPMVVVVILAAVIYIPGAYRGWFDWKPPAWLSIHALVYQPLTVFFMKILCRGGLILDSTVSKVYDRSGSTARVWCNYIGGMDSSLDRLYEKSGQAARGLADRSTRMDKALDDAYTKTGQAARKLVDRTGDFDHALDQAYEKTGRLAKGLAQESNKFDHALDEAYEKAGRSARRLAGKSCQWNQDHAEKEDKTHGDEAGESPARSRFDLTKWNIKNLNFDTLLLAAVLGIILFVIFYYAR